ncbi:DeoR/GlpR family DNA-binding transcription regulator [Hutsoniella sourekii]|uniref:DeoR/GlpR family DNA-binding transcription regulator n=1 Tax=Hutsoniella sourekii TaxID=87650 RepID=UPI0004896E72|nr:DeoR/GlpR family DNA-binding transcription regulator [Hutsoniella sourekii]
MYSEERHNKIVELIHINGKVSVNDLAKKFKVSKVTIRRDLELLDMKGIVQRTYGGAIEPKSILNEYSLSEKEQRNIPEKKLIAENAQYFLDNDMTVYLDSGTTTKFIINHIPNYSDVTVITPDVQIGYELSAFKTINLIQLGGRIDRSILSANSIETILQLEKIHFDIAFIGCDGFDLKNIYASDEIRANLKKIALNNTHKRILLADSSKYPKKNMYSVAKIKQFDSIVTDRKDKDLIRDLPKNCKNVRFTEC